MQSMHVVAQNMEGRSMKTGETYVSELEGVQPHISLFNKDVKIIIL